MPISRRPVSRTKDRKRKNATDGDIARSFQKRLSSIVIASRKILLLVYPFPIETKCFGSGCKP